MTMTDIDYYVSDIAITDDIAVLGVARENDNADSIYVY